MTVLAQEIWTIVSSNLSSQKDLTALASVSLLHLHAVRPVLYRDLRIVNNGGTDTISNQRLTFSLLASDNGALARRVEHLEIFASSIDDLSVASTGNTPQAGSASPPRSNSVSRRRNLLIPPDVLRKMANLRSLSICGIWPFNSEEARTFVDILNALGVLEEISVDITPFPDGGTVEFGLKGLKRVRWFNSNGFSNPFSSPILKTMLLASNGTITHLLFPSKIDDFEAEHVRAFATLHSSSASFPNLTTLALGHWFDVSSGEPPQALMTFLRHHPSLEHIHLGWDPTDEFFVELDSDSSATTPSPSVLPRLRTLSAHPRPISVLARNFPSAFQSIERLRWGTGLEEAPEDDISQMLSALQSVFSQNVAAKLKRIDLVSGESTDEERWTSMIEQAYETVKTKSPRLEEISVDVVDTDFDRTLERYLPESVKVLRVRGLQLDDDNVLAGLSDSVLRIARRKPTLIRIVFQRHPLSVYIDDFGKGRKRRQRNPKDVVAFRVTRSKGDSEVMVSQCAVEESDVENGDEIFDF